MTSRKNILALAFAASIAMAGAVSMADAGPIHRGHMHAGPMHAGSMHSVHPIAHWNGHGPGHWHGHHRWWGYGVYPAFYGGDYYYGGGCGWLHRKAVVTGSPYWWSRYETCVGG